MYISEVKSETWCNSNDIFPTWSATVTFTGTYAEINDLYTNIMRYRSRDMSYLPITSSVLDMFTPNQIRNNVWPSIKKVIFNNPATIVLWSDNTKTVVKCKEGDTFNEELGLAMCISKKYLGNKFHAEFKKWVPEKEIDDRTLKELIDQAFTEFTGGEEK